MKKIIAILLFIAVLSSIKAQNFIPIPEDTTSYWKISGDDVLDEGCYRTYVDWFYIMGKRTINNKTYYKLYSKGHWVDHPIMPNGSCSGEGNTLDVYEGALRTENNIIYYVESYSNYENILFDYNLKEGDTVPSTFYIIKDVYDVVTVSSIDSVLTGENNYRTRWNMKFSFWSDSTWFIEGIGTDYGIFQSLTVNGSEHNSSFNCYSENYQPVYPPGSNCDPTVNIVERAAKSINFNFYPNPSNGVINVEIDNPQSNHYKLEINDLTGKRLLSRDIDYHALVKINCENIQSGIYFLTITSSKGEIATKKLVINHLNRL